MTDLIVLRPMFLLLLLLVPALYVAYRRWPPPLSPGRARVAMAVRATMITLVVVALADVRAPRRPRNRAVVAVVDLSDSAVAARQDAMAAVQALMDARGQGDLFGVVTVGRDAQVEVPLSDHPTFEDFQTNPDGGYTDLSTGLALAANLIPDGYARQVVLISDGRQNLGDAEATVEELRANSVRVDVAPLGPPARAEVLALSLDAPQEIRSGEGLAVEVRVRTTPGAGGGGPDASVANSPVAAGVVSLSVDGAAVEQREVSLGAGVTTVRFDLAPPAAGIVRLRATVEAEPDGFRQNNVAEAVVTVRDRPKLLLLEGGPGEGTNVTRSLQAAGMTVEVRRPAATPADVTELSRYDAFVVAGAPADEFAPGSLAALSTAVGDLGRGLVAIGSPDSFGPGGWGGTPLEDILPVRMDLPRPRERPAAAVAIVLETMEDPLGDSVALGAIDAVIDQLRPDDEMAVIAMFGPGPAEISPLARPLDKAALKRTVRAASLGDPQNPAGYKVHLEAGIAAVSRSQAANKHVVIIGDGDAVADLDSYDDLFAGTRAAAVTVSSIGVNIHHEASFMDHMGLIGRLGGGRFYLSDTAAQVPGLLLDMSRNALRPWFEQTPFFPIVTSAGSLLDGVDTGAFPELDGYVATTAKPGADVALASPKGDPVLAAGYFGLGRTVAWTPDAQGRWTSGFLASPVAAPLFGRLGAWVLPTTGSGDLRLEALPRGAGLELTATGPDLGGEVSVRRVPPTGPGPGGPGGETTVHTMAPVGPGRWRATVPAAEVGTYLLNAVLSRDGVEVARTDRAVAVPYSPEYLEHGRDDGFLAEVAKLGGALLGQPWQAWDQTTLALNVTGPIYWPLLLAAVILWPLDVALRRVNVSVSTIVGRLIAALRRPRRRTAQTRP